jgi:glycosyltransferase involved in cell wall biosynthesis
LALGSGLPDYPLKVTAPLCEVPAYSVMYADLSISVVIPTWNEAKGIAHVLGGIPSWVDEIVVVDACSTDGTADIARANGARVYLEPRRGYGRAFKTGFTAAKGDVLVSADGDGTYPLVALPRVLDFLLDRKAMFVSCSRLPLNNPAAMHRRNRLGNQAMTIAASLLWGQQISDILSGMWAMRREAWVRLDTVSDSWNFSEEIKLRALDAFGPKFLEFHIEYAERLGETKLSPWKVGVENLVWLAAMRLGIERQMKALVRPRPRRFEHASVTVEEPAPVVRLSRPFSNAASPRIAVGR